jgi:hypothetical protein
MTADPDPCFDLVAADLTMVIVRLLRRPRVEANSSELNLSQIRRVGES